MNYFNMTEFGCKCCGLQKMDKRFIELLNDARRVSGVPFVIMSGYRCPKQNMKVGSTSNNHLKGVAADVYCGGGHARLHMLDALLKVGFKRIGISTYFIHADINDLPPSIWLY